MGNWFDELSGGNYISVKEGTDFVGKIERVIKITTKPDFDPKRKDGTPQGFHFEIVTDKGTITVGSFALQSALVKAQVKEGDTISISHPKRGEYLVKLIPF